MDYYDLYTRNRQRLRWMGSKVVAVLFHRYTLPIVLLLGSLIPIAGMIVSVFAVAFLPLALLFLRDEKLPPERWNKEVWSQLKQLNTHYAIAYIPINIIPLVVNWKLYEQHGVLDTAFLLHAIGLLLYGGIYVAQSISLFEYRYREEKIANQV